MPSQVKSHDFAHFDLAHMPSTPLHIEPEKSIVLEHCELPKFCLFTHLEPLFFSDSSTQKSGQLARMGGNSLLYLLLYSEMPINIRQIINSTIAIDNTLD